MRILSKNTSPKLLRWGLLLIGALLGGGGLIGNLEEYQEIQEQVAQLQGEVAQSRSKVSQKNTLQAEITRLEEEIKNLLQAPITGENAPAVIASTVTELGWRSLKLTPTPGTSDSSADSGIRRTSFSAEWQSTWEGLLQGVAALKRQGIFVRNLGIKLDQDGSLRCEAALVYLSQTQ